MIYSKEKSQNSSIFDLKKRKNLYFRETIFFGNYFYYSHGIGWTNQQAETRQNFNKRKNKHIL